MSPLRRALALCAALLTLSLVLVPAGSGAEAIPTMAALGDSLTTALRSCSASDCSANSWSTGTSAAIDSHLLRLRADTPSLAASNFAVSGRKVSDLNRQAAQAVATHAGYVTILIGTNDVCRESVSAMTPVTTFRTQFTQALATLTSGLPASRIFVSSIPDPSRLRDLFGADAHARAVWAADTPGTCAVFLNNATSEQAADVQRRAQAQQRLVDLDSQLAEVCALHPQCVFDADAVTSWRFAAEDISTIDYFHFSAQGQADLAALTYPLAFPPADVPSEPGTPPSGPAPTPAVPVSPPGAAVPPPRPPSSVAFRRLAPKLKVRRASIGGGRLHLELSVTGRATGRFEMTYDSGGHRMRFSAGLGASRAGEKDVLVVVGLSRSERRHHTGTLRVSYPGDAHVYGDDLRARVAAARSRLRIVTASLTGRRLRVRGTIDPDVIGDVELRVRYARPDGTLAAWSHEAAIGRGRWSTTGQLPAGAVADAGAYLTLRYTGDGYARGGPYDGEQDGRVLAHLRPG